MKHHDLDWHRLEMSDGFITDVTIRKAMYCVQIVKFNTFWKASINPLFSKPVAELKLNGATEEQAKRSADALIALAKEMKR